MASVEVRRKRNVASDANGSRNQSVLAFEELIGFC